MVGSVPFSGSLDCFEFCGIREKLKTDDATALFRKYYKRYYARTKVRQIKLDDFKQWNYKAVEMRDRCQDVEITPQDFEEWLYNSFKNRKKKE